MLPDDGTEIEADAPRVSREEYSAFISQIELRSIWLARGTVENFAGPITPSGANLQIEDKPAWRSIDQGFRAESHYFISIMSEEGEPLAELTVILVADFESSIQMTDEVFSLFGSVNLPLNTWPYLREFISTSFGRMNWLPLTVPALKRGVFSGGKEAASSTESPTRARTKRSSKRRSDQGAEEP